jgi:outer membrane protein assembly factor BamA
MLRFWLHFLLFIPLFTLSQKEYRLRFSDDSYKVIKKKVHSEFRDSLEALNYVRDFRLYAIKKGYLLASNDSLRFRKNELTVRFYAGQKFGSAEIHLPQEELKFLRLKGNLTEKTLRKLPFNPREISQLLRQCLETYENNGYPFCKVYLDNLEIVGGQLRADLKIEKSQVSKITKINLPGNPVVSVKLISSYIQIREGDLFSQEKINEISSKLRLIPFIDEIKPCELLFTPEGVELFLYLKAKPVSLANGVVGLQPDPVKGKMSLTGELRLKLVNTLKKAELFELNWRSIQEQTSSLKLQANLPNLFQTPFGFDGQFQLYRRDSTFLELKSTLAVQYALKQGNFLKGIYRRYSSNVLAGGANSTSFSNLRSVETNYYGLSLSRQNVDYLPSPRKGTIFLLEATVGTRTTKDSIPIVETTYRGEIQVQYYLPLAKRHILKFANFTELYFAPAYFENELFRFGGQISLRGFNEEEILATSRSVSTLEYRFLLDRNSFLFAFYDQGWYENKAVSFVTDTPFGFGGGFAFGTTIGNFSVSYALGSQFGNPVLFRDGKVHFGYIAYF